MSLTPEEIEEFKVEATELLDDAESKLLALDKGGEFKPCYDAVFRVFHSLKGASGFLGLDQLQHHMHQLESQYQQLKDFGGMSKKQIGYFLKGIDVSRVLLEGERESEAFNFDDFSLSTDTKTEVQIDKVENQLSEKQERNKEPSFPAPAASGKVFVVAQSMLVQKRIEKVFLGIRLSPHFFSDASEALALVEQEKPEVFLIQASMQEFTPLDCLRYLQKNGISLQIVVLLENANELGTVSSEFTCIVDISVDERILQSSLVVIMNLCRLDHISQKTLNALFDHLPDIAVVLSESGREDLIKEVDHEFRQLMTEKRNLKVS